MTAAGGRETGLPAVDDTPLPARRLWGRLADSPLLRRAAIVVAICALWQGYASWLDDPLILPSFSATCVALAHDLANGVLPGRTWASLTFLAEGYAAGVGVAVVLTALAVTTRIGDDLLSTLTAMLGPLPGIVLLPLMFVWFGLGTPSMIVVLMHSVMWPLSLNARAGLSTVPESLRLVGRNYGLGPVRLMLAIMVPAALPSILSGLRVAWAFAWRTLIGAELLFGMNSGSGGLGWYIYTENNLLETASVFAGLLTVVVLGLVMEAAFRAVEARTVRRWGIGR